MWDPLTHARSSAAAATPPCDQPGRSINCRTHRSGHCGAAVLSEPQWQQCPEARIKKKTPDVFAVLFSHDVDGPRHASIRGGCRTRILGRRSGYSQLQHDGSPAPIRARSAAVWRAPCGPGQLRHGVSRHRPPQCRATRHHAQRCGTPPLPAGYG